MSRETLSFTCSGPHPVAVDDTSLAPRTGCIIYTLIFPKPTQVGEITFRNFYTWAVDVHILKANAVGSGGFTGTSTKGGLTGSGIMGGTAAGGLLGTEGGEWRDPSAWQVGVSNKVIMPHPHTEASSHAFVSITCLESKVEWQDVVGVRLILQQPSPVWHTFSIHEITAYRELPRLPPFNVPILNVKQQPTTAVTESALERLVRQTVLALQLPAPRPLGTLKQDQPASVLGNYEINSLQYT